MIKTWENMAAVSRFDIVHDALIEGLDNLAKWYKKTDDSTAYFICLGIIYTNICLKRCKLICVTLSSALDPNFKVVYAQHHWGDDSFNAGLKMFEHVVSITVSHNQYS